MTAEATLMGDIKDLAPLAKKLNEQTDALNSALETIQEKLNALKLGVEVWLENDSLHEGEVEGQGDGRSFHFEELGYGRLGDRWALIVRTRRREFIWNDDARCEEWRDSLEGEAVPLLGVSRQLRIAAVPQIPQLIDKLKEQASAALERIDQAKKIAESLE